MIIIRLLFWLDAKILGIIEKFAQQFQRATGKTNYFLTGLIALIIFASICVILFSGIISRPPENSTIGIVLSFARKHWFITLLFAVGALWESLFVWQELEAESFQRLAQGLANPRKNKARHIIYRLLGFFILGVWNSWQCISYNQYLVLGISWLLWVDEYLEACDPLPPCRGKIQEFFQSFFLKPAHESANED